MRRAFQKVSEQNQAPDYVLKRFAATEDSLEVDPYEGLRQRAAENQQRIAHDELVYGRPEAPKPTREWEQERIADTYRPRQMSRNADSFEPEDLSRRSVRRVETAETHNPGYRPMESYNSGGNELYVTRMDAERMLYNGESFFDPQLAEITSTIAERDMRRKAEQAMRDKQSLVGSQWEKQATGRARREHKRVLDRWSNFDAVNGGFTRVANEREAAGRFGMADPTAALQRDMLRQEAVQERMQRKAAIKGIDHATPAQRNSWEDEVQLMAGTMQQDHSMSWISDFFKGK
jgi:hypothetical protein